MTPLTVTNAVQLKGTDDYGESLVDFNDGIRASVNWEWSIHAGLSINDMSMPTGEYRDSTPYRAAIVDYYERAS